MPMKNATIYNRFDPSWFFCPNTKEIKIWGDDWKSNSQIYEVFFYAWVGYVSCQNISSVNDYISGLYVFYLTLNSQYDENDSVNPIKQYFDYHRYILISNDTWKDTEVSIGNIYLRFVCPKITFTFKLVKLN